MNSNSLPEELINELQQLDAKRQREVLDFVRALAKSQPRGVPGNSLLSFAGGIPNAELELMRVAIEEGCEKVATDEW